MGCTTRSTGIKADPAIAVRRLGLLKEMMLALQPSIVTLQEAPLILSSSDLPGGFEVEKGSHQVVTAFNSSRWILHGRDDACDRLLALRLDHVNNRLKLWQMNLHVPVLWADPEKRRSFIRFDLRRAIDRLRGQFSDRHELIVGDFNLSPHDVALIGREGLNANRSLEWTRGQFSPNEVVDRPLFNPTWGLYGLAKPPLGTFYLSRVDSDGPWVVVDQALMSADLAEDGRSHVKILDKIGTTDLCRNSRVRAPNEDTGSDHLPIAVEFQNLE